MGFSSSSTATIPAPADASAATTTRDCLQFSAGESGNHGVDPNNTMPKAKVKDTEAAVKEKEGILIESSRASCSSSSCPSTISSVECSKPAQQELLASTHIIAPESPFLSFPKKQLNSPLNSGRQSTDLRDVVKDSIHREKWGLSVKTKSTAEGKGHGVTHVDSPRPLQLLKSVKQKVPGVDGSSPVLAELREKPRSSNQERSPALLPKDAPRFSYDGRESREAWKSVMKLKELPRLSLDSREGSIRRSATESRSNHLLDELKRGNVKSSQTQDPQQEPGSNKRPSSLVAKLMGLEAFPDSVSVNNDQMQNIKHSLDEDLDAMSTTSRKADEGKHKEVSRSPRTASTGPASPQLRNTKSLTKLNPKFPLEPAPWRQTDGKQGSQKPAFMHQQAHTKAQNLCPSVYGEIERRLTELEFQRSGKDLRALKQILEAMQKTRERLQNKKDEQTLDFEPQTSNHSPNYHNLGQISISSRQRGQPSIHLSTPTIKVTDPAKKLESSIVIIKPARVFRKNTNSQPRAIPNEGASDRKTDSVEKQTSKNRVNHCREPSSQPLSSMDRSPNARIYRSIQTSKASHHLNQGNPASFGRSPIQQQKQHGMDKLSRPTTPKSDSSRARRHLSKQQAESGSPRRRLKPKSSNPQQGDDQLSKLSTETRQLSHQGDEISVQSESNISSASHTDIEVTSIDRSKGENDAYQHKDLKNDLVARFCNNGFKAESTTATLEQPSPVSVLDTTFYREESPSPVKKISHAFKDDESLNSDQAGWNSSELDCLLNSTGSTLGHEFDRGKLENIKDLIQQLKQVYSTDNESEVDHIASLCGDANPEHRYIAEILLASGLLLKDLGFSMTLIQLHPSGHFINPSLFLVLEQTKGRIEFPDDEHSNRNIGQSKYEKIQRKLIFDTVNDILVHKLASAAFSLPWISPNKLQARSLTGQKLLRELCSEIDHLQATPDHSLLDEDTGLISILSEDMMHQDWAAYHSEIAGMILVIERLIFKDLIHEVVSGEVAGRPTKHYRRLFPL
ncbi:protein LONGIFOLIA 1-like isoform X2 [Diospyros lotus]|uniref:protein LONGIFOLIA 1-like isoform X2 n=1 Tax=Diospyros lotus TaxID=55363 RepID=UPI0022510C07|nr:protein LONGIFOLIA 1-like isoform X2 [Diospyros lotus]